MLSEVTWKSTTATRYQYTTIKYYHRLCAFYCSSSSFPYSNFRSSVIGDQPETETEINYPVQTTKLTHSNTNVTLPRGLAPRRIRFLLGLVLASTLSPHQLQSYSLSGENVSRPCPTIQRLRRGCIYPPPAIILRPHCPSPPPPRVHPRTAHGAV